MNKYREKEIEVVERGEDLCSIMDRIVDADIRAETRKSPIPLCRGMVALAMLEEGMEMEDVCFIFRRVKQNMTNVMAKVRGIIDDPKKNRKVYRIWNKFMNEL